MVSNNHERLRSDPFSSLARLRAVERGPTNLPVQPTPLIGREKELKDATELLLGNDIHLLTFTGTGGTGKTRLSIEVAWVLVDKFPGGVFLVSLASTTDHNLVLSAIMNTLGIAEQGRRPLIDCLKDYLRDKRILLVLDNFEHLMSAASLVSELLAGSPELKILVTSRAPLRVRGEHEFLVLPLMLPDMSNIRTIESVLDYSAVALFVQRAQSMRPDFTVKVENARTVAEICIRLDGLPLALELAAARLRVLTANEMLKRLQNRLGLLTGGSRDLPARQRTLRDTIAWSYELLDADDRKLFRQLAVFANGFSLEAVEAVSNAQPDTRGGVLEGLSRLAERSLIQTHSTQGGTRFGMLETIREFALEALATSTELKPTQEAYIAYFLSFAETAELELKGPEQGSWLSRLDRDHDNLRGALRCAMENKDEERGLRFVSSLWYFWYIRGHWTEGRLWLTKAVNESSAGRRVLRAKALRGAGALADVQDDFPSARGYLEESLALFRDGGDREGMALALNSLGLAMLDHADLSEGERLLEQSLALMKEVGNRWGSALVLNNLGVAARAQGKHDKAVMLHRQCLELFREFGDKRHIARMLINLGINARDKAEYDEAGKLLSESLSLSRELGREDRRYGILVLPRQRGPEAGGP